MSDNTIIQQGSFVSAGVPVTLQIRSDVDWMRVVNYSQTNAQLNAGGIEFYWQRGMAANDGIIKLFNAASTAINADTAAHAAVGGFTLVDSSASPFGPNVAITASTNATQPVISTASTLGLVSGSSVVKLSGITAVPNLGVPEFLIDTVVANTSFRIANALANAPGAAGTNGFYRIVKFDPLFYPRRRFIANITQAAAGVASVRTTIPHGYTTGQLVRFTIPANSGMVELNGMQATVAVTDANNFVISVDTSAFTAFSFPTVAQMPGSFPLVVPVGEDNQVDPNSLADATENTGYIGMLLAAGITSPAGQTGNVMYWVAGKSFSVD